MKINCFSLCLLLALAGCERTETPTETNTNKEYTELMSYPNDIHTYARPNEAVVRHLDLDIEVDFDTKTISGVAGWQIENLSGADEIIFDTRSMEIEKVKVGNSEVKFTLDKADEHMGSALHVPIDKDTRRVSIYYRTGKEAEALQWLEPQQTAGGKHPFLFTQSQAILARTWVPVQDGPGIRFTYKARVKVPNRLMAVMSASNPQALDPQGVYNFDMPQPIPAYLMALSVGNLEFEAIGERTAIYAEPEVLKQAVYEFADMEKMLETAEALYGPYQWGRYDVIVLPPSFPFGGMENPRLTFATPTILAGDRSLTSLIAHELAHSWSGNLVTNATWSDFWLNEGFTVYFERRIMEALYGKSYAKMLEVLGYQDLLIEMEGLGKNSNDTKLKLDLKGRNPDDGVTSVPYEKGYFFLRMLEERVGRERFDAFVKKYFDENAFHAMDTESFLKYMKRELLNNDDDLYKELKIDQWIYETGLPDNLPLPQSERFAAVDKVASDWAAGKVKPSDIDTSGWTTHEWMHFIRHLPEEMTTTQMAELDKAFSFSNSGNAEIQAAWLEHVAHNQHEAAYPQLRAFLNKVGRRKFLLPLYKEMAKTEKGKELAQDIYRTARPGYHSVSVRSVDEILGWK